MRFREEYRMSGGRFVPAAEQLLPPTRTARLQGGRFVPAADQLLPDIRTYRLQNMGIDYEHAYHFGARPTGRREE